MPVSTTAELTGQRRPVKDRLTKRGVLIIERRRDELLELVRRRLVKAAAVLLQLPGHTTSNQTTRHAWK